MFQCFVFFLIFAFLALVFVFVSLSLSPSPSLPLSLSLSLFLSIFLFVFFFLSLLLDILKPKSGPLNEVIGIFSLGGVFGLPVYFSPFSFPVVMGRQLPQVPQRARATEAMALPASGSVPVNWLWSNSSTCNQVMKWMALGIEPWRMLRVPGFGMRWSGRTSAWLGKRRNIWKLTTWLDTEHSKGGELRGPGAILLISRNTLTAVIVL